MCIFFLFRMASLPRVSLTEEIKNCEWSKIPEKCGIKECEFGPNSQSLIPHFFVPQDFFPHYFLPLRYFTSIFPIKWEYLEKFGIPQRRGLIAWHGKVRKLSINWTLTPTSPTVWQLLNLFSRTSCYRNTSKLLKKLYNLKWNLIKVTNTPCWFRGKVASLMLTGYVPRKVYLNVLPSPPNSSESS